MHTVEQLKAARAALDMTRSDVGEAAGVSPETVKRLENQSGELSGNVTTINALRSCFESKGIIFIPPGETAETYAVGFKIVSG